MQLFMMQKKPTLYIFVETKARELEGRTLLALEAANHGFQVIIGNIGRLYQLLNKGVLPKGVCYEKSLSRGKEKKLKSLKDKGYIIVSQDEETGLAQNNFKDFLNIRSTPETVEMASAIYCFGNFDYDYWTKLYPSYKNKIHLTGSPRLDYWQPKLKNFYRNKIDQIQVRYKEFILISSNFGLVNGYLSLENFIAQRKINGSINTKNDEQAFRSLFSDTKKLFIEFVDLVNYLANRLDGINIVIRPHPSEKFSAWQNAVASHDNIHVVFRDSITPWVHASSAVLHNSCTTAIEAYVIGKPALAFIPFKSKVNRDIPNRLSLKCTTKEDVLNTLNKILNNSVTNNHGTLENDAIIYSRLNNTNDTTSAKIIVENLLTLDVPKTNQIHKSYSLINKKYLNLVIFGKYLALKQSIKRYGHKLFFKKWYSESKKKHKFPGLELSELKQIQTNLQAVDRKYSKCEIHCLIDDLFLITKAE